MFVHTKQIEIKKKKKKIQVPSLSVNERNSSYSDQESPTVSLFIRSNRARIELQVDSKLPFDPDVSIRFRQSVARESCEQRGRKRHSRAGRGILNLLG